MNTRFRIIRAYWGRYSNVSPGTYKTVKRHVCGKGPGTCPHCAYDPLYD